MLPCVQPERPFALPPHPLLLRSQRTDTPAVGLASDGSATVPADTVPKCLLSPLRLTESLPSAPPAPPRWHSVLLLWRKRVARGTFLMRFELPASECLGVGRNLGDAILLQASWAVIHELRCALAR